MSEIIQVTKNKKAYHDYFVESEFEAGIALRGTEVKSVRMGRINLKDSYCGFDKGELFVYSMHISPYETGNRFNHEPKRKRKLLMHRKEINRLFGLSKQQGYTLIPLSAYFKSGKLKLNIGLCKGKKLYDKRAVAAKKEAQRKIDYALKDR
ncbi:MAG: SsrA-binding protein SmpB [Clostridia bacterium]|nr:SsrA-binding protein SmpB [Clostridia bacterium]